MVSASWNSLTSSLRWSMAWRRRTPPSIVGCSGIGSPMISSWNLLMSRIHPSITHRLHVPVELPVAGLNVEAAVHEDGPAVRRVLTATRPLEYVVCGAGRTVFLPGAGQLYQ